MMQRLSMKDLEEISRIFNEAVEENKKRYNAKWESLTDEDQIDYFCAIMERVHEGDVVQKRSYRGVLYDIFGWGPEAYMAAQCAGYLDIHNMIYDGGEISEILKKFAINHLGHEDNEELQTKLNDFMWKKYA